MEVVNSANGITIQGNIKSVKDLQTIKESLDVLQKINSSIIVTIEDSITITSSVIGYFNKLVLKDKIDLQLKVGNSELIDLLTDLNLVQTFKVTKI